MTDFLRIDTDYESYPPSVLEPPNSGPSTSATAGVPGEWLPPNSTPPATVAELIASSITAVPPTAWVNLQYVQTGTAGAAGRATWTGTAWVGGQAPALLDPAAHTIDAVKSYIEALIGDADAIRSETQRVLDAERAGSARSTLISWLDQRLGVE